jgi:hypothetical protein
MGSRSRLRAGDRVALRSPDEILRTLDDNGTLDSLPFMPEMLDSYGATLRVQYRAEKTCVDVGPNIYPDRRFVHGDVVVLGERCDGRSHDGCKRGCKIFWKESWLRRVEPGETVHPPSPEAVARLRSRLRTATDGGRYFCQSTELQRATEEFPGNKRVWRFRILAREVANGDRTVIEAFAVVLRWSYYRMLRRVRGYEWLRGPHEQATPSSTLDLQPGDAVSIKSRSRLQATLDRRQRNRGLSVTYEMTRHCGQTTTVRNRIDKVIDEQTGEMRVLENTVALNAGFDTCLCGQQPGDCPRGEVMYWREIWLDRIDGTGGERAAAAPS